MKTTERLFDNFFATIGAILMSFIRHLGKFIVPMPPAWYWGTVVARSSGNPYVGIFAAIALEIGGMLAAHYAIAYYGTVKGHIAAGMTGLYLIIGIGVMWLMESTNLDTKLIITAIFLVAGMVYGLSGMTALESETKAQMANDRQWQRQEQEKDNDLRRQLALQRQADKTKLALTETKIISQPSSQTVRRQFARHYECVCGRVFEGSRSYNAHRKHCEIPANEPARVYENGASGVNGVAK